MTRRDRNIAASPPKIDGPHPGWSDERLVRECLNGSDEAWSALIDKYEDLVYSIPRRYGAGPEDAADIFQSVCIELFSELPRLEKTAALRGWLITVTAHKSFHWKRKHLRLADREGTRVEEEEQLLIDPAMPSDTIDELEREQMMREAIAQLSPRCQELIRMLFYLEPPVPYRELAQSLGLQVGSIGFIRGRCLQQLQKVLTRMGF